MLFLLLLSKCFQHLVFLCMKSKLCCFLFLRHSLLCWILFHILKNLFAHKFIGMLIRFHWVPFILSFDPESVLFGWHPKLFVCALCCQLPHSCVCWSKILSLRYRDTHRERYLATRYIFHFISQFSIVCTAAAVTVVVVVVW